MQTLIRRLSSIVVTLAALGLPLFLLLTSWIPDRWPDLLFDALAVAGAGVFLVCWAAGRPVGVRFDWSLAAPLAAALIGLIQLRFGTSVNPNETLLSACDWFGLAALYFMAQQFFGLSDRLSRYFPAAAMTFSTVFAIYAVVQWFTSQGRIFWIFPNAYGLDHVLGTILNRNHYAAYIELFLPAVFWYFVESPARNPHAAIATGVLFASIVASTSRGGFAVAVFELVVVFMLRQYWDSRKRPARRSSSRRRLRAAADDAMHGAIDEEHAGSGGGVGREFSANWFIVAAVAVLVVFTLAIGVEPLQKRILGEKVSASLTDYGQSRWEYVEASVQMVKARPALGFGLGTWPEIYPAYGSYDSPDTRVNHAHNDPIEWLAEGGFVFLIPLGLLVAASVQTGFAQPWALGPAAVLIHSLVDFPLHKPAIFSALLLILAAGRDRNRRGDL